MTSLAQQIESLLFMAGEAVSFSDIAAAVQSEREEIDAAVEELRVHFMEHGLAVVVSSTHVQLVTSPQMAPFIKRLVDDTPEELSSAALETLSIIAYRGPLTRIALEGIRGVDSRRMLRQLLIKGLIERVAHKQLAPQYQITELFLRHLGITKITELPDYEPMPQAEKI